MTDARAYLGKMAESYSAMDTAHREAHNHTARVALDGLHELLPDLTDDQLARVSYTVANMTKALALMTVSDLAMTLDNSQTAYALAAASLMNLYDVGTADAPEASSGTYDDSGAFL